MVDQVVVVVAGGDGGGESGRDGVRKMAGLG